MDATKVLKLGEMSRVKEVKRAHLKTTRRTSVPELDSQADTYGVLQMDGGFGTKLNRAGLRF